ncbi:MAG TPA: hypothetical protein VMH26_16795 [Burkholderiales bacterium]|nr:hypothetical protein [Burkholderiales bacterium]
MNLKLTLTLTLALAIVPLLAVREGFRPDLGAAGSWTHGWQEQGEAVPGAQGLRFDCVATGADLLRRAAPAIAENPNPSWTPPTVGLTAKGKLACLGS